MEASGDPISQYAPRLRVRLGGCFLKLDVLIGDYQFQF
jgi:hypothetical protein